jgi:hypothetical protein
LATSAAAFGTWTGRNVAVSMFAPFRPRSVLLDAGRCSVDASVDGTSP